MNILIVGAPGSGKGTMSERLVKTYQLQHISTGDIFRQEIARGSDLGKKAQGYIEQGLLVPDEVTNPMVVEYLSTLQLDHGYLLDGYPRNLVQARLFEEITQGTTLQIDKVINLVVSDQLIIERICGRMNCPQCKRIYHRTFMPPLKEMVCDQCQVNLVQRADDTLEQIQVRLQTFRQQTTPILQHFQEQGILVNINGEGDPESVFKEIQRVVFDQR